MKYDLDLEAPDPGTSHAIVLDLVGTGKRVLDVGCSTGYLARLMAARGNTVSGVELDPEAAAAASPHLAEVVVGDLGTLDLTEELAPGSFDVLVFADVLEHLVDPVDVLRRSLPLLAAGGSVVISIPNVAHGAVRLHLLEGSFEYRSLGLLDDTHLRFFTRSSLESMLRAAGVVAVDMRRTVADALATEIPVPIDHFPTSIVDDVRRLPDADTYQFVVRAVPLAGAAGGDGDGDGGHLAEALSQQVTQLAALRSQVTELVVAGEGAIPGPSVAAVVDDVSSPFAEMRAAVVAAELRSRTPRMTFGFHRAADGPPTTFLGAPVATLPHDEQAVADLAAATDSVVVVGDIEPARVAALSERGVALHPGGCSATGAAQAGGGDGAVWAGSAVRTSGVVRAAPGAALPPTLAVPDPLVAVDRLVAGLDLNLHLELLSAVGRLPHLGDHVTVVVDGSALPLEALARAVSQLAADGQRQVVVTSDPAEDPDHSAARTLAAAVGGGLLLEEPCELDLLAVIATASDVVATSAEPTAVALALGVPVTALATSEVADGPLGELAAWTADPDLVAATPADVLARAALARARAADPTLRSRLQDPLDLGLDDLSAALSGDIAARLAPSLPSLLRRSATRLAETEQANAALQGRLIAERGSFAQRLRAAPAAPDGDLRGRLHIAERRAAEAEADAAAARAELAAHHATLTMRALAPSRRLYGRIRRLP